MIDIFSFVLGFVVFLTLQVAILAYHVKGKFGSSTEKSIEELEQEGWEHKEQ